MGGVRALCVWRHSYLTEDTFSHPTHGQAQARLAVCRSFTSVKRTGRKKREAQWLIFILLNCAMKVTQVSQKYRQGLGIAMSYRCAPGLRGWTTAHNAA